jgi:CheY-like chemotaxis protein
MLHRMKHPSELQRGSVAWGRVRLLVFSLDDDFRFLVRSTFRKLSIRDVASTSVPADGLPLLARGADLVLLDLGVQPDQGFLLLERMRASDDKRFIDVPVLAVVPVDQPKLVRRAQELGIEGMVPKPISGHELVLRVSETLTSPTRMPLPDKPAERPRVVFNKPGATPPPAPPPIPIPLDVVVDDLPPSSAEPRPTALLPRPSHGGGTSGVAGAFRPGVASGVGVGVAVAPRPSAGVLGDDDLAVMTPGGGVLVETAGVAPKTSAALEGETPAARRRREMWEAELAQLGHEKKKPGGDVAVFDVTAVAAEHVLWLQTKGAEGKRANLEGMDLAGADLSNSILANATFRGVDLSDATLTASRLDGADLRRAILSAANLSGANLGVASLRHANLSLANLDNAVLRGADLSGATLRGAKVSATDFKGAMLVSTDLREADLSKAENLIQSQVDKTLCDMSTKLPPGIFRPRTDGD